MTGPSDRWTMHGQRSNQCMDRLIGLTRPTAIVINKEARIHCFYRMSVVNCSRLYKSRWTIIAKFNFIENLKKIKLSMTKKKGIQIEYRSPARWTDFKFELPYYGTRYMHFHFINVWTGQDMTISCKAKGRESNDSKNHRMWYRIILLNKCIYFFIQRNLHVYSFCFLFKTMT